MATPHHHGLRLWRRTPAIAVVGLLLLLFVAAVRGAPAGEQAPPAPSGPAAPPPCAPSSAPVKVLALGDSLTNGAVPSLNANHPYALRLGELLRAEFGGNRPVDIKTVGANAAGTIMTGLDRVTLPQLLSRELNAIGAGGARPTYDVIVLEGGINDIGRGNKTAAATFDNLKAMVSSAARSARYAVVFIPPWANRFVTRDSDNEAQRQKLLVLLNDYFAAARGSGPPALLLLDGIDREFAFWTLPAADMARLQDDKLHLTPAGYDALGGRVFEKLLDAGVLADIKCGTPRKPQVTAVTAASQPKSIEASPTPTDTSQAAAAAAKQVPSSSSAASQRWWWWWSWLALLSVFG